ncbi:MAG: ribosome recycling factor [Armatimonadetes bacterium RBG_16_58_9]|nr:MAG: ribosome recycling factor [Armatimonadetes bacterium RBG_16_58_9]
MTAETITEAERKMRKSVDAAQHDFATIRTGRANPMVLEGINVDYYGTPTPLAQLAGISAPEPRLLMVTPWDRSVINAIMKAIQASDVGLTPMSDGNVLRLQVPYLTEERRNELVKQLHRKSEDHKVAVRNIRREANDHVKAQQKDSEISEDDMKREQDEIQKLTDKYSEEIDQLAKAKEAELREV